MELRFLDPVYETDASVASVYLDTTRSVENAPKEIELRWRGLRERLASDGAPEDTLAALDEVVGTDLGMPGPHGTAYFAAEGRVLAGYTLSRRPDQDRASWLPVPDTLPLIADRDAAVPYVLAQVDRVGADIHAYGAGGEVDERSVDGGTLHIRKVHVGDWAHKHYQRRSENLWAENAARVADDVETAVTEVGARLLLVTGDVRALAALREHLLDTSLSILVEIEGGGRGEGSHSAGLDEAVDEAVGAYAARERAELIGAYEQERGRDRRAVDGGSGTAAALSQGQVDTLLIDADGVDGELWASPAEAQLVSDQADAPEFAGRGAPIHAPGDALLIRAAHATDAEVVTVAGVDSSRLSLRDHVGAVLRFTTVPE
ncbi:Vms1/Ankzf1 family peptidyl-tRNA hydrolase [Allonocardiopsis opalescens]|uniref:Peptide subunit release factor 1 (ERF1) n=1 Tax=Allonocardiopsis opalescens TaxID=1144618 RepID=A0A2T0QE69_9ACTN|nr:Vms1/Ankzf1 family peptidyl-tRNA hydrolase [Allonocardiopsis opalescens]PRY02205.1 hypothetical protein CLV72_101806 [Allonocardiopsis opalescens]